MSKVKQRGERRQQILETLAKMLEESPGARITTAKLAKNVGFSEAALYRHFPSKTKMLFCYLCHREALRCPNLKTGLTSHSKANRQSPGNPNVQFW